tara:strand:+ start:746 stop:1744 length:999 start_codon:yes stop_codon:yes gene_type:complete
MKLIAETSWHHDGDFNYFKNLVKSIAKNTNCDYIKFHLTLNIDEYINSDHEIYNWVKEKKFSKSQWKEIFDITCGYNKKLMLLFNDTDSIKFGMQFNPEIIEIHSTCLNDIKLLKYLKNKIKGKSTKIVLGVGGTEIYEIDHAIKFLSNKNIVLMHGFQNYPTNYKDINFLKIKNLMLKYEDYKHGYADHTSWDDENNLFITLIGASLGMKYIEKHVTNYPGKERVDYHAAIGIDQFNIIEKKLIILEKSFGDGSIKLNSAERIYSKFGPMKKAAISNRTIEKNEIFLLDFIDFKRTSQISDLTQVEVIKLVGKKVKSKIHKGEVLNKMKFQ